MKNSYSSPFAFSSVMPRPTVAGEIPYQDANCLSLYRAKDRLRWLMKMNSMAFAGIVSDL